MTAGSSDGDEAGNRPTGTAPGDAGTSTRGPAAGAPAGGPGAAGDATAIATAAAAAAATDDAAATTTDAVGGTGHATATPTGQTSTADDATGSAGAVVPGAGAGAATAVPSTGTAPGTVRDPSTVSGTVPGSVLGGGTRSAAPTAGATVPGTDTGTGEPSPDGFPYGLVATDLDGTLLRSDHTISPRTRDALAAACAAGAAHLVVTGRSVPWTRHVLDDLGYRGLAVCGQGAQLYHAGEHRLLTSITLDRQLADLALTRIEAATGPLLVAVSLDGLDGEVLIGPGYRVQGAPLPVRFVDEAAELWAAPLSKIYLQHPELGDDSLARAARAAVGGLVSVMMSGEGIVELLPPGLSKATGLALAARRLSVPPERTIAFGDMPNDLPMFNWAARGVAMANAHPELLTVADEVTASNDEDGIALVLERLLD